MSVVDGARGRNEDDGSGDEMGQDEHPGGGVARSDVARVGGNRGKDMSQESNGVRGEKNLCGGAGSCRGENNDSGGVAKNSSC